MGSPASAAKARKRGQTVQEQRAQRHTAQVTKSIAKVAVHKVKAQKSEVTGGKAKKTGMVLARAQLRAPSGGVVASADRQNAMLAKNYREAEKVAREASIGTMSTPPSKKDARKKGESEKNFTNAAKCGTQRPI